MRIAKLSIVTATATLAMFGVAGRDGGLKLTAVEGDSHSYTLTAEMSIGEMSGKLNGKMVDNVVKVSDDGNIKYKENQTGTSVEFNGQHMDLPDHISYVTKRPDGTTAEISGEDTGPASYRLDTLNSMQFPKDAMAVGATWTWDVAADAKTGVVKAKGEYKVLADEKLHDIDCWKISTKVTELEGDQPASTEATVWISKSNGMMVKASGKGKDLPYPGAPSPVSGTETLELVK